MPTSVAVLFVSSLAPDIAQLAPESVLDVGCGFGFWGFLCRFILDAQPGRHYEKDWKVRIEGVETYEPYIMPHQRFLYDRIHIGRIEKMIDSLGIFDMYIFGDVLEHIPKDVSKRVFQTACEKARKGVLVNIPIGDGWLRSGTDENPDEAHLSTWNIEDFLGYAPKLYSEIVFPNVGRYTSLLIDKTIDDRARASQMIANGLSYLEPDPTIAERCFRSAIEFDPTVPNHYLELVNCLISRGKTDEAVICLKESAERFPEQPDIYDTLYKLLRRLNRIEEAREVLARRPESSE